MKKLAAKMRRIRMMRWGKLTTGEKIAKVIWTLVKWAAIVAVAVTIFSAVAAVVMGVVIGIAVMNAIGGGLYNAGMAYKPGDRYYYRRRW